MRNRVADPENKPGNVDQKIEYSTHLWKNSSLVFGMRGLLVMCTLLFPGPSALLLGYRVVAPGAKWIAAEDAPYCEGKADKKAAFLECFNGIG